MYKVTVYLLYADNRWTTKDFKFESDFIDQGYVEDQLLDLVDDELEITEQNGFLSDWMIKGWTYSMNLLRLVK